MLTALIKEHSALVADSNLHSEIAFVQLHESMISTLQAERVAHLKVMLTVFLFLLLSVFWGSFHLSPLPIALSLIFLLLLVPYIFHYYFLENTLHRWYGVHYKIKIGTLFDCCSKKDVSV